MPHRSGILSLEDICVRWISKNIQQVTCLCNDCDNNVLIWKFLPLGCRISARPTQKILLKLCKHNFLKDQHMTLFSYKFVDLLSLVIKDASISSSALNVLSDFKLYSLTATGMKNITLNGLISCLGKSSAENLISLNFSNPVNKENKLEANTSFIRLKNLQVLNVSKTKFTSNCLQDAVIFLPKLRHLNISRTSISSISPLLNLKNTLTGLVMHRINIIDKSGLKEILNTILQLKELRTLDISCEPDRNIMRLSGVEKLCTVEVLPYLTCLDISGNQFALKLEEISVLIENHPNLEFLGVVAWPSQQKNELEGLYQLSLKHPHITMVGDRGEKPLLATLTRNRDRRIYLQKAFHNIFEETSSREWLNPDLLSAVLRVMRLNMSHQDMILAGTAVVYNLTRGEQSAKLPLDLLNRAVNITLLSIENHQQASQLLKNCFLTLCSDTVLHRAQFSCKRCCELVFKSLINFDDMHMKRMGVAIISILAAEIPTSDLRELSLDKQRLQRLLIYVVEKCLLVGDVLRLQTEPGGEMVGYLEEARPRLEGSPIYDTTLRFTLSALWNLTDECPEACQSFVQVGGLLIYAKVLKKMTDQDEDFKNHVYTKCLGLLNNVAEVASTKTTLLMEPLMFFFYKMLSHTSIQISYFAAGIVSHLACLTDDTWCSAFQYDKSSFIKVLGTSVCNWSPPQTEMVAYRSFQPFQSLILHPNSRLEIHLWAVWAIHHILTKKDSRYVPVLAECPDLQLFLLYVISTDPITLCAAECRFGQFLQTLNQYHETGDKCINTPTATSTNRSGSIFVPTSWKQFSLHETLSFDFLDQNKVLTNTEPDNKPPSCLVLPILPTQSQGEVFRKTSISIAGGDNASFLKSQHTPTDSVGRLSVKFEATSTDGVGVTTASVGPDENQKACACLLQKLAREILWAVENFENTRLTSSDSTSTPNGS